MAEVTLISVYLAKRVFQALGDTVLGLGSNHDRCELKSEV